MINDRGFDSVHHQGQIRIEAPEREGIEPSEILYFTVVMSF